MDDFDELRRALRLRRRMALWLAAWAAASMLFALLIFLAQDWITTTAARQITESLAAETLLWGLIEVGFALAGLRLAQRADRTPLSQSCVNSELRNRAQLVRLLRFASKLDWGFLFFAIALTVTGISTRRLSLTGHGIGIGYQSVFLLCFNAQFLRIDRQ